ncbi:hypothetical protein ACR6C2_12945 [Streptomyces sp. INA 01156]
MDDKKLHFRPKDYWPRTPPSGCAAPWRVSGSTTASEAAGANR